MTERRICTCGVPARRSWEVADWLLDELGSLRMIPTAPSDTLRVVLRVNMAQAQMELEGLCESCAANAADEREVRP